VIALPLLLIALLALLGLAVGSFLNVVITRVPEGASVIQPKPKCPTCEFKFCLRDRIPVLSWLLRHGRCRGCESPISARYPIVEIVTAVAWAGLATYALMCNALGLLPLMLCASAILISLFVIDLDHKRLPDRLTFLMYPVAIIGLAIDGLATGSWPIGSALLGAAIWLIPIGGIWLFSVGRGMGMGDVKLAPALGLILGWVSVGSTVVGLASGWLIGGVVSIVLILVGRARSGTSIPFGPFLIAGFGIGLAAGAVISDAYLGAVGF
jgi:leader peptidase (prepilin peptidase)/N-methyltransferase